VSDKEHVWFAEDEKFSWVQRSWPHSLWSEHKCHCGPSAFLIKQGRKKQSLNVIYALFLARIPAWHTWKWHMD